MPSMRVACQLTWSLTNEGKVIWTYDTQGGFELAAAADSVKVEVLNAAGTVVDTVQLGAGNAGVNALLRIG